jgi:SNF2 family DNA or RNA helicase
VASEGINLHYLSHRLIHFDIPWSLMVFQQRNGRIDRYGQEQQPDIRYFLIQSKTKDTRDARILEILVQKEEQAHKEYRGIPHCSWAFLTSRRRAVYAAAIETNMGADAFGRRISTTPRGF